jgi:sialic acid synthase SpsE
MDIAAIALGVNLVEKTITHDRATRSIEHMFSLEPPDMRRFVRVVRDVEAALGSSRKLLSADDLAARRKIRRSAHLKRAVRAGERLVDELIEFRRPGDGIGPHEIEPYFGARFDRDVPAGDLLRPGDLERRS